MIVFEDEDIEFNYVYTNNCAGDIGLYVGEQYIIITRKEIKKLYKLSKEAYKLAKAGGRR